jgi:superfamily II DNA/RNA helicase
LNNPKLTQQPASKFCYLLTFFMQHVKETDTDGFKRLPKTIVYVNGKRKADSLTIQALRHGFKVFSFHGERSMTQVSDDLLTKLITFLAHGCY